MTRVPIVAIASSAGDLDPVGELLSALPSTCGMAFLIVPHLDNSTSTVMPGEALANRTHRPVMVAQNGAMPQREHVYVARANTTLTLIAGSMSVSIGTIKTLLPADALFRSLAAERGSNAIGVVLSGAGCDGALGLQAIKKGGGSTFAQYPGSARFPSMPINAIEAGGVGFVLRPNEIAHELTRLIRLHADLDQDLHRTTLDSRLRAS